MCLSCDNVNWRQQLSVMQQSGALFHTVVCLHKLVEVEYECAFHNSIVLAMVVTKITKVGKTLTKS